MDEPCSQQAWGVSGLLSRPLPPRCPAPALTSCRPCLTAHALLFVPWCKPIVQPVGTKGTAGRRFLMSGELDCVRTACVRRHPDVLSLCRTLATAPARRACAPASLPALWLQPLHSDVPLDNNAPGRRPQPSVWRAMGVSGTSSMSPQQRLALIKLSLHQNCERSRR